VMTRVTSEIVLAVGSSFALSLVAKASLACLAALIVGRLCRRSRAAVRHLVYAATFAVLLILPIATAVMPPTLVHVRIASADDVQTMTEVAAAPGGLLVKPSVGALSDPGITPATSAAPVDLWRAAWLAGVAFFLAPVVTGLWQLGGIRHRSVPWLEGQELVDSLAAESGVARRIVVLRHEHISGPLTCGVIGPAILLPADVQDWKRDAVIGALTHEIEHVRRNDATAAAGHR